MQAIKTVPIEIEQAVKPTIKSSHQVPDCGPQFSDLLAEQKILLRRDTPSELQLNLGNDGKRGCRVCQD